MRHDGHQAKPVEGDKVKQTFAFQGDALNSLLFKSVGAVPIVNAEAICAILAIKNQK